MSWKKRFETRESALCVGLDPVAERMPEGVAPLEFCHAVVDATAEFAACFKPNAAFFERMGPDGMRGLPELVSAIRERDIPVIIDAKRGDIGSTARMYAEAYFGGPFDCDALTVNPSVGLDAIEPFLDRARELDRGVFLLLRTSNPGAAPFQEAAEPLLIEAMAREPNLGAVVGATDPEAGARLRGLLPDTLFLVPGLGAQGGAELGGYFTPAGRGAVVNSSRGILYAGTGPDWRQAVHDAARQAHEAIEKARK